MTQPPQYPGQPEYQGQPEYRGPAGQGWPPPAPDPFAPPASAPPASAPPYAPPPASAPPYAPPPASAPPGPPTSGQPFSPPYAPPTGAFGQPTAQFPPPPTGQFPTGPVPQPGMAPPFSGPPAMPGYPMYPPQAPAKKGRGLLITLIVLAVVVVLGGGGGAAAYFVMQNNQGTGQPTPVEAVNGFLTAVYRDKSTDAALKYVCPTSRDRNKLSARIDEIRRFDAGLSSPTYTWPTPKVESQNKDEATLTVPVKVTTTDEKVSERTYRYLATHGKGWWVCEVTSG